VASQKASLDALENAWTSADFDPGNPGKFSRVDTSLGTLFVLLRNSQPYLDGHKISIEIGNPYNSDIHDIKIKAKWGPRFEPGKRVRYAEWEKSLLEREFSPLKSIAGGEWTPIDLVLSPAASFGYLEVSIDATIISLKRASKRSSHTEP
jgi:hypothetical protein